jgi:hypothetical protein
MLFQADLSTGLPLTWMPLDFAAQEKPSSCFGLAVAKVNAVGQSVLLMVGSSGTYASTPFDDTTSLAPMLAGPGFPLTSHVRAALQLDPAGRSSLLWATDFGLYSTTPAQLASSSTLRSSTPSALNGPARVATPSQRLDNVSVQDMAVIGSSLYAIAQSAIGSYGDVMVSSDAGANWNPAGLTSQFADIGTIRVLAADSGRNVLYAGTDQGVYFLRQGNTAWQLLGGIYDVRALAVGSQALYAGRSADASPNGGLIVQALVGAAPFAAIEKPPVAGFNVRVISVSAGSVYVAGWVANDTGYGNAVYFASDFTPGAQGVGPNWKMFGSGSFPNGSRVTGLAIGGGTAFMGGGGFLVQNENSQNGSWGTVNGFGSLPPDSVVNALASDATSLYVGTDSLGLLTLKLGNGTALVAMNGTGASAVPSLTVNALHVIDNHLYASTAAGLAVSPLDAPAVVVPSGSSGGGGGGCSVAAVGEPDPLLWLLVAMAILQIAYARRRRIHGVKESSVATHQGAEDRS